MRNTRPVYFALLASFLLYVGIPAARGEERPAEANRENSSGFRGPNRNGCYPAQGLLKKWPEGGPKLLWEKQIEDGWTSASVADGRVYFCGRANPKVPSDGKVWAFSLEGQELWKTAYGPEKEVPRATPAISGGLLFYESNLAVLYCLDARTGDKKWSADLNALGDTSPGVGGVSASPLVYGDFVIVATRNQSDNDPSFVAFEKQTGKLAWKGNLGPCTTPGKSWSNFHQTPILVDTGAKRLVINGFFRCVGAVQAETGEKAWTLPTESAGKNQIRRDKVQPVFNEGYLFSCGTLMQKLQPDGSFTTLWEGKVKVPEYNVSYSHTLIRDGRLFAFTPPELKMLDAESGQVLARLPCGGQGSLLLADGMLYLLDNRPRMALIEATKDGMKEVSFFRPPIGGRDLFTPLVVAEGRLFLRKQAKVYVYDLRAAK